MRLDGKSKEIREWLIIAKRDLDAGKILVEKPDLTSQAAFFAQQAAEEVLKAFLVWHQERFKKEHDIRYLGDLVTNKDPSFEQLIVEAVSLNPYAVTTRYPGFLEDLSIEEAAEALDIAKNLYDAILAKLPKEVHP